MSQNILYNVVRENVPNSPVDDQGLMDIARSIVGTTWPTGINRLRFVGFRYSAIGVSSSLNVATNEIGMILNVTASVGYTLNVSSAGSGNHMFGVVFNRIATSGAGGVAVQYALFTYN